uniref:Calcium load-activated calcium channel n=1 Tax=Salmo salar TaxID=8030 RepID=B9EN36_SALSA|nr:Transmembrane and coiled-coil domain-containing protein 1 [Salmo salar]
MHTEKLNDISEKLFKLKHRQSSLTLKQAKLAEQYAQSIKDVNSDLTFGKIRIMVVIGFCTTSSLGYFLRKYAGIAVAKLPFVPFSLVNGITHKSLEGTDFTDSSFLFIYIISSMVFRQNLRVFMGFNQKRVVSFIEQPY